MSYTMPSKQKGKVKTAAEVHIHGRVSLWSHIINHRYKHACGSSLLSFFNHHT